MSPTLDVWRSGTGKVLVPGDHVKIDGKAAVYRITAIHDGPEGVTVDAYGGKPNHLTTRTVTVDRVALYRKADDPNAPLRETIREVSRASKAKRRGIR